MGKRKPRRKAKALAKRWCHQNARQVTVIYADPITAVEAMVDFDGKIYYGDGGARCCRLDEFSRDRGFTIAMGRAAAAIAAQLVEAGEAPWKTA